MGLLTNLRLDSSAHFLMFPLGERCRAGLSPLPSPLPWSPRSGQKAWPLIPCICSVSIPGA